MHRKSSFRIVIPSRYASSRLPGKPLADICGKPMIVRVLERVQDSGAMETWVATDHEDIRSAVEAAGGHVQMTRPDHSSGTDRLAEVAALRGWEDSDIVVNVQGDEPLIDPALVASVAETLAQDAEAVMATAAHPIDDCEEAFNSNVVKVVCNAANRAMYFSRAPIPWPRDAWNQSRNIFPQNLQMLRHVGLYAYRVGFLKQFASLSPSPLEDAEALEQLRALWHGFAIAVKTLGYVPAAGVDTPEDLERVRRIIEASGHI